MDNCIFCKIASKEIPSNIVWENDDFLAFLDIRPIKAGHTLVVPKKHTDYLFDIEDKEYSEMWMAAKTVAEKLKQAFTPKTNKVGIIVYGVDVPHAHIHLVPLDRPGELNFAKSKPATKEELKISLDKIKAIN